LAGRKKTACSPRHRAAISRERERLARETEACAILAALHQAMKLTAWALERIKERDGR